MSGEEDDRPSKKPKTSPGEGIESSNKTKGPEDDHDHDQKSVEEGHQAHQQKDDQEAVEGHQARQEEEGDDQDAVEGRQDDQEEGDDQVHVAVEGHQDDQGKGKEPVEDNLDHQESDQDSDEEGNLDDQGDAEGALMANLDDNADQPNEQQDNLDISILRSLYNFMRTYNIFTAPEPGSIRLYNYVTQVSRIPITPQYLEARLLTLMHNFIQMAALENKNFRNQSHKEIYSLSMLIWGDWP